MTPARRGTWSSTGRWCRRPRCTMHTCRRWRSHTRRSPRRTSTPPHRQPEPDGLPSRRRHDLMKPLHLIALLAALMGPGCTTALPGSVPEVAHATSPAPGIISAGRLVPADIGRLRGAGIRHVIDLTPDEETPDFDEAAAVRAAGLGYSNLPLAGPPDLTRENVLAFDTLLRDAKRPVLVHCASGNRRSDEHTS